MNTLEELRRSVDDNNNALLELIQERGRLVVQIRAVKEQLGLPMHDPRRQQEMIDELVASNTGPYPARTIRKLFTEIHNASVALMEERAESELIVGRTRGRGDHIVEVAGQAIGTKPFYIAGPCAVESFDQLDRTAAGLAAQGVRLLRAGAFKPRTSPYSFQGLGLGGLRILREVGDRYHMGIVSEVVDPRLVEEVADIVDVLQVGCRNMFSYELLKEAGRTHKPVLLKRSFSATIDEWLQAAEYIALQGNEDVILCERGIRTFERRTRNTLDISAVPLVRSMSRLPVVVDVSHAAGRRDLLPALSRAAFAAGAHGVMIEVHHNPAVARSDAEQQLSLAEFAELMAEVADWVPCAPKPLRRPSDASMIPVPLESGAVSEEAVQ
jgi:3-deoxy-7-phosphoheptulonate synthase/chorismate mutase